MLMLSTCVSTRVCFRLCDVNHLLMSTRTLTWISFISFIFVTSTNVPEPHGFRDTKNAVATHGHIFHHISLHYKITCSLVLILIITLIINNYYTKIDIAIAIATSIQEMQP